MELSDQPVETVTRSTQAVLCYEDMVRVIADAKQKLFDITKWIVTLHSLTLGAVFSSNVRFSPLVITLPLFVGLMGIVLNRAINAELAAHRRTLARLRKDIGGLLYDINRDQVEYFLAGSAPTYDDYFVYYKKGNVWIVILASALTFIAVASRFI